MKTNRSMDARPRGHRGCGACDAPASAQSWPTQRVTIVVPFGAGSVTDILARIFADEMGRRWGQQVIVENRPGLAGTAAVAKATPDGHTLMVTSNGHTVAGLVSKDAPFDPVKDFAGITRLGSAPLFLISHPDVPAKTAQGGHRSRQERARQAQFLLARARQHDVHCRRAVPPAAGINIVHVPFRSAPDAVTAVIRGDAQFYFAPVNLARDQSQAGKVRAIAAATAQRIPELPDTPTFTEAGLPFVYDSWFGLMTQAAVPQAIRDKISKDWADAIKTPDMQAKLKAQFLIGVTDTPAAMDKIVRDETAQLTETFKAAGIGTQ